MKFKVGDKVTMVKHQEEGIYIISAITGTSSKYPYQLKGVDSFYGDHELEFATSIAELQLEESTTISGIQYTRLSNGLLASNGTSLVFIPDELKQSL